MNTDIHINPHDFITQTVRNLATAITIDDEDSDPKLDAWAAEQTALGRFPPEPAGNLVGGLAAAFARPKLRASRATELTEDQIAALIGRGQDPYADAIDEAAGAMVPEHSHRLALLARAAMCITTPEARAALAEPLGVLFIEEADESTIDRVKILLQANLLPQLVADDDRLSGLEPGAVARTEAPSSDARPKRIPATLLSGLGAGRGCVLIGDLDHLPDDIRGLVGARMTLPPLDAGMVIAILRGSHSRTGQLAEAAILDRLPNDTDLSRLPDLALASAFSAPTTLAVADRLSDFVARLSGPRGPAIQSSLDSIVGLPQETRAPLDALITDMTAWRSEIVPWSDIPSSFLLDGPPGVGKTQIARGLAGDLGIPLIAASYAQWQGSGAGHLGTFLAAMKKSFDDASRQAPCIFFLDEIDSFPTRREDDDRGAQYNSKCVNGLLTEMNRLPGMEGVIFIAATNHADRVDPAILRSGRLDTKIHVPPPDRKGLKAILRHYLGHAAIPDKAIDRLGARLLGQTGADVEALVRRAKSLARMSREDVSETHREAAADRLIHQEDPDLLQRIAVHETGHILVGQAVGMRPRRVRIATSGGETHNREPSVLTADAARRRLQVMMAGRAAERLIFGDVSNGSGGSEQSDLANATRLAVRLHRQWGLGDTLTRIPDSLIDHVHSLSPALLRIVEKELRAAEAAATAILEQRRKDLDQLTRRLLAEREIDFEDEADWDIELKVDGDCGPGSGETLDSKREAF